MSTVAERAANWVARWVEQKADWTAAPMEFQKVASSVAPTAVNWAGPTVEWMVVPLVAQKAD